MKKSTKLGTYFLAVAFALAITLSGGIAKADGVWHKHHDQSNWWSDKDKDNDGPKHDFKNFKDWDNDGWISYKHEDSGNCDWKDGQGKEHDPNSMPEPSSLALLSVGILGLGTLLRRRTTHFGVH